MDHSKLLSALGSGTVLRGVSDRLDFRAIPLACSFLFQGLIYPVSKFWLYPNNIKQTSSAPKFPTENFAGIYSISFSIRHTSSC
ncbi:hypothetical protein L218DRAFT_953618 [Marasmius fiardii PR-910]|nr:hypothetical protein L218DRAFT_953618 [Marasmius fiardii PR-910]